MGRLAFDVVNEQLARANERADNLQAALVAIQRRNVGLPERPRQDRPPLEPMPADLAEHYNRFSDRRIGRMRKSAAYQMHADGTSWDGVREKVLPKVEEEE